MKHVGWFFITFFIAFHVFAQEVIETYDEALVQASKNYSLEITLKKSAYQLEAPLSGIERIEEILTPEDQASFLATRKEFLSLAAKGLQSLKMGFGVGVTMKNYFRFLKEKRQTKKLLEESLNWSPGQRDDLLMAIQRNEPELNRRRTIEKNKLLSQKADEAIQMILNSLDRQLWEQAEIVAHANEFGFMVAAGIELEGGTRAGKGWGGLTDLGVSIGFNKDEKSLAIQVFHDMEKFKSTQMPMVFIAGAVGKGGFYVANQNEQKNTDSKGTSFYPPMAPGFSSSTNRSFMAGASSGLTWPPSPLGDMLTYTNTLNQVTLLRVTISPLTKGFFRIKSDALKKTVSFTLESIKKLMTKLGISSPVNQCSALFEGS
jgi:hypothetical protein